MRLILKAKSAYTNDQVAQVFADIEQYVTVDETQQAIDEAVAEIRAVVGLNRDRVVYGWSGGKDSVALQVLMEAAGIQRAVLGLVPAFEFTDYTDWVEHHRPEGLTAYGNPAYDLPWLARDDNHRFLFPKTAKLGYFWTLAGTRWAQLKYQEQYRPILQIYGRRRADGNQIGQEQYGISTARNGITSYSPMRAWPHELVLAVVHYYRRPLPPVYWWPHGWTAGTGAWAGRRVSKSDDVSWADVWTIEPAQVRAAAAFLPAAKDWMNRGGTPNVRHAHP
jgi:hypothetical protein